MIKTAAFILLLALRIGYHPGEGKANIVPFASPLPVPSSTLSAPQAKLISFHGFITHKKVVLNWVVEQNETADQFEVEKSTDGKHFILAALVFGTDKTSTGNYQFYEKAGNQKVLYRIRIINKNHQSACSPVIEINPNV